MIRIRDFRPNDLLALFRVYCDATAPVTHAFVPSRPELDEAIRTPAANLRAGRLLLAEDGEAIVGFTIAGLNVRMPERWQLAADRDGLLVGPFFVPGMQHAGRALVEAAEQHISGQHGGQMWAFDPASSLSLPFYNGGFCGLSEKMSEAVTVLARSGFRIQHRELYMKRPAIAPPMAAAVPPAMRIQLTIRAANAYSMAIFRGTERAGAIHFSRMYPARSRDPQAASTGYIDGLDVTPSFRERGLGRLLLASALGKLATMGAPEVLLTTGSENYRAQNLYYSMDFVLVDTCVAMAKPLDR